MEENDYEEITIENFSCGSRERGGEHGNDQ